jgi:hypothetical protein
VITIVEMHGYVVRHKSEASRLLQFSRTQPFPRGLNFREEALERIRKQITLDDLKFETYKTRTWLPD